MIAGLECGARHRYLDLMCNLYTTRASATEIAAHFKAGIRLQSNAPEETLPGYPGLVVREDAGERIVPRAGGLVDAPLS